MNSYLKICKYRKTWSLRSDIVLLAIIIEICNMTLMNFIELLLWVNEKLGFRVAVAR
jgi:hypothetical protein